MSSSLALLICIIFVFIMLRLDHKQSPGVSFALWIPTIWMLIVASRPLALWFQAGGTTIEEGSPLDRVFLTVLLCLGLIILTKRKFSLSNAIKENIWLMVLLGYLLVSCIWSDIPFISFKRWNKQLVAVVMAFVVATEPSPRKALESLFRRIIYITIPFSYTLIHYFGEYGRLYVHHTGELMWTGVAIHKNSLAQLCLFAAFFLIWMFIKRKQISDTTYNKNQDYLEGFVLILTFWILGGPNHTLTYSATTTVSLTLGLLSLIGLLWENKKGTFHISKVLGILIIAIFIYGTLTPMLGKLTLLDPSSALGREKTLTGRTVVWERLAAVVMDRPLLGHGYGGFWTTNTRDLFDISDSHNGYLGILLDVGIIGLSLYALFVISCIRNAQRLMTQDSYWGILLICFLVMVMTHNIGENSLNAFGTKLMAIILLLTISFSKIIYTSRESR